MAVTPSAAGDHTRSVATLDPATLCTDDDDNDDVSGGAGQHYCFTAPTRLHDDDDTCAPTLKRPSGTASAEFSEWRERKWREQDGPVIVVAVHSCMDSIASFWHLLFSHTFRHYLVDLTKLAVPTCMTQMLRYSCNLISTVYCGHMLDSTHFSAVSTGLTFTTLTALSLGAGIASAMDTLSTQAHGRTTAAAKSSSASVAVDDDDGDTRSAIVTSGRELGEVAPSGQGESSQLPASDNSIHSAEANPQGKYLRQSLLVTYAAYTPVALLYLACGPLIHMVVAEEMASLVVVFLQLSVFIVVPMLATNNVIRYSQSQRYPMIGFYASLVGAVVLLPVLLIARPTTVASVAWCLALNRWMTLAVVLFLTCRHADLRRSWGKGWVASFYAGELALPELRAYFTVGLPSLLANMADTWSFELMSVLAASVSDITSATWSVLFTIYGVLFSGFVGIANAASVTVGNAVGQGSVHCAQSYAKAVLVLTVGCGSVLALTLFALGGAVFGLIQSNPKVTSAGANIMHLGAFTFLMDVTFYVMQGIYRGIGQQRLCAVTVFVGMWLVTIPSALILTKAFDGGVTAILTGLTLGLCVSTPLQWYLLFYRIDWNACIDAAAAGQAGGEQQPPAAPSASNTSIIIADVDADDRSGDDVGELQT